ncbi:hypothetical protein F2P56_018847 [Juglans regia]|uniref:Wall-associated receptor kinase galacturonan-binding domain-containing protein n=1 Tax=Juglans regia TaxID=51240 RepID=A0A833X702_JUGRE|nr:hypothetical protein F2P56_018847 [Juglans regia]
METTPSLLILALSFSDLWLSLLLGRRGMAFPIELKVLISTVLALILVPPASSLKNNHHYCPPSSCGNIPNISYLFRLKGDPPNCGDQRYELSCDDNNHTLLSLNGSKYYVSQINYNNYTIRIVDSANVMDVEESCTIEQISLTSWPGQISADPNISCTDIRNVFSYGFELSCDRWENVPTWVIFLEEQVFTAVSYNRLFWLIAYCFGVSGEVGKNLYLCLLSSFNESFLKQ